MWCWIIDGVIIIVTTSIIVMGTTMVTDIGRSGLNFLMLWMLVLMMTWSYHTTITISSSSSSSDGRCGCCHVGCMDRRRWGSGTRIGIRFRSRCRHTFLENAVFTLVPYYVGTLECSLSVRKNIYRYIC